MPRRNHPKRRLAVQGTKLRKDDFWRQEKKRRSKKWLAARRAA